MLAHQDPLVVAAVLLVMELLVAILFWLVNQALLPQLVAGLALRLIQVVVVLAVLVEVLVVIAALQ
jgi:hypothetical protein